MNIPQNGTIVNGKERPFLGNMPVPDCNDSGPVVYFWQKTETGGKKMKIAVLNGSPSGGDSITLYTVLYLRRHFPEHTFEVLDVG